MSNTYHQVIESAGFEWVEEDPQAEFIFDGVVVIDRHGREVYTGTFLVVHGEDPLEVERRVVAGWKLVYGAPLNAAPLLPPLG